MPATVSKAGPGVHVRALDAACCAPAIGTRPGLRGSVTRAPSSPPNDGMHAEPRVQGLRILSLSVAAPTRTPNPFGGARDQAEREIENAQHQVEKVQHSSLTSRNRMASCSIPDAGNWSPVAEPPAGSARLRASAGAAGLQGGEDNEADVRTTGNRDAPREHRVR